MNDTQSEQQQQQHLGHTAELIGVHLIRARRTLHTVHGMHMEGTNKQMHQRDEKVDIRKEYCARTGPGPGKGASQVGR